MVQGIIRLLLMLQCYKFNLKTDNVNSWCQYCPFSFFKKNLFKETEKVKPKFLHSVTGQNEYSTSRSGSRIYKAFSQTFT